MLPKLLAISVFLLLASVVSGQILVNTTNGEIEGQIESGRVTPLNIVTFYGIPYAGNVDGENRFKAAPPPPVFPGIFHAHVSNIRCAQPTDNGLVGVENCLVLNVQTRNTTGSRPVMVWLMGENYATGSYENVNFSRFVEIEDVLVVTMNYRLSIFGFLCLGVEEAPGNAGLKDVIAGLRWVRDNIAAFGGDPNNVLLAGHGSGGAMVDLVTLSPLGTGLVHKAIAQSGTALSPWAVSYNPIESARSVAARLDTTETDPAQLALRLRNTDLNVMIPALDAPTAPNNVPLFAPCVENRNLESEDHFLLQDPLSIIKSGEYSHIPFITGYTNREGSVRAQHAVHNNWLETMESNFENFIPIDIDLSQQENRTEIIASIRNFYFAERTVPSSIQDYLDYHGDTIALVSAIRTAAERSVTSRAEVRLYEFSYIGNWVNEWPFPSIALNGARHGNELVYLLGTGTRFDGNAVDNTVRDSLTRRWAAFARTGLPLTAVSPGNIEWFPVTPIETRYLEYVEVTENAVVENAVINPHSQRMNLWYNLYDQFYVAPQPVSSADKIFSCAFLVLICMGLMKLF